MQQLLGEVKCAFVMKLKVGVLCNLMLLNGHIKEVKVYAFVLGRFNILYKGFGFYPRNHSLKGVFWFPMHLYYLLIILLSLSI